MRISYVLSSSYLFESYIYYEISGKSREKIGRKYNKAKTYKKSVWIKITTFSNDAFSHAMIFFKLID